MTGSLLDENSSFKMLGLPLCSKFDWGSYTASVAKTASKTFDSLDSLYKASGSLSKCSQLKSFLQVKLW